MVTSEEGSTLVSSGSARLAGVELGGTKCVCTLAEGAEILAQVRIPTTTPEATLEAIERTLRQWREDSGFEAVGIASFGPVELDPRSSAYGFITSTTKAGWRDTEVLRRLTGRLGVPVAFDTDVNAAALAELRWGAGRGFADFAYITVGTGVGVGLIVRGEPTRGFSHGELGHIRVARLEGDVWPGACPYHGACVEGLASGSAIAARLGGRNVGGVADDDPIWEGVAYAIAQLCHVLVSAAAPQRIVVGGGVVDRRPHLLGRIEPLLVESLAGYMTIPRPGSYVTPPGLGDRAGPLGPIALARACMPTR
jgi:fructokinase